MRNQHRFFFFASQLLTDTGNESAYTYGTSWLVSMISTASTGTSNQSHPITPRCHMNKAMTLNIQVHIPLQAKRSPYPPPNPTIDINIFCL